MKRIALALVLVCATALSACGQKGPLYLPDETAPMAVPPTSPVTVVPPARTQEADTPPPAGAAQSTEPRNQREKSSR